MTARRWPARDRQMQDGNESEELPRDRVSKIERYTAGSAEGSEAVDELRSEPSNLEQLGEHVTSVLAAAEAAASRLRAQAEQDAQRVREEAAQAAHEARERAKAEADAERGEARREVSLAEEEARATRAEADSYAERRRRAADEEALRVVLDAEQRASELAGAAAERHRSLLADISASETRMRNLASSLRDVAVRLDDAAEDADIAGGEEAERTVDETLLERVGSGLTDEEAVT